MVGLFEQKLQLKDLTSLHNAFVHTLGGHSTLGTCQMYWGHCTLWCRMRGSPLRGLYLKGKRGYGQGCNLRPGLEAKLSKRTLPEADSLSIANRTEPLDILILLYVTNVRATSEKRTHSILKEITNAPHGSLLQRTINPSTSVLAYNVMAKSQENAFKLALADFWQTLVTYFLMRKDVSK